MGVGGYSLFQVGEKEVKQLRLVLKSKAGVWKLFMNDFPLKDGQSLSVWNSSNCLHTAG